MLFSSELCSDIIVTLRANGVYRTRVDTREDAISFLSLYFQRDAFAAMNENTHTRNFSETEQSGWPNVIIFWFTLSTYTSSTPTSPPRLVHLVHILHVHNRLFIYLYLNNDVHFRSRVSNTAHFLVFNFSLECC